MPRVALCFLVTVGLMASPDAGAVIVSAAWLHGQLASATGGVVVVEVSWTPPGKPDAFALGHIPGAVHLNTDELENGYPRWHLRPDGELQALEGELGIAPDSTVVVYGQQTIAAARAWWVLHYAGVRDVCYLDGGLAAWRRHRYPVEKGVRGRRRVAFAGALREETRATTDHVAGRVRQGGAALADVRSDAEYLGTSSGYSYLAAKGRIPGAILAGNADDSARIYQHAGGMLRSLAEVRREWRRRGLLNAQGEAAGEIIFYCGSGWRSSLAFLYAHAMGLKRIRNYSDGWSGWSTEYEPDAGVKGITPGWRQRRSANPVAAGKSSGALVP